MKEKKTRNKFKDVLWDYYVTNKKITSEYEEEYKKNPPGKYTRIEKVYVVMIVVGLIIIALKYFVF